MPVAIETNPLARPEKYDYSIWMISLQNKFKTLVLEKNQKKGLELFNQGRTLMVADSENSFDFSVRDRNHYQVKINKTTPNLSTCTCSEFEDGYWCRHIWSAVLKAEFEHNKKEKLSQTPSTKSSTRSVTAAPIHASTTMTEEKSLVQMTPVTQTQSVPFADDWRHKFNRALEQNQHTSTYEQRQIFVVNFQKSKDTNRIIIEPWLQEKLPNGQWGPIRSASLLQSESSILPSVAFGFLQHLFQQGLLYFQSFQKNRFLEPLEISTEVLDFDLSLSKISDHYYARAVFRSGHKSFELSQVDEIIYPFVLSGNILYEADFKGHVSLFEILKKERAIEIPEASVNEYLDLMFRSAPQLSLVLPPELEFEIKKEKPQVRLNIQKIENLKPPYQVEFEIMYGDKMVNLLKPESWINDIPNRVKIARDLEKEKIIWSKFREAGLLGSNKIKNKNLTYLGYDFLMDALEVASHEDWLIHMDKKVLSRGQSYNAKMSSGIDWFEVHADFKFSGTDQGLQLPEVLKALDRNERLIQNENGEWLYIPQQWSQKFKLLNKLSLKNKDNIKISKVQALFLSSFFLNDDNFLFEEKASSLENILDHLRQLPEQNPAENFMGQLRPYQKKGLGWIELLKENQIGGILADDMGLGKTVMMLASFRSVTNNPTLIVAPKSLIFNWAKEIQRFIPEAKVIEYTGTKRKELLEEVNASSIIVTTYHTLRQDIEEFKKIKFDLFVMDEAHYIKNSDSQSYMACKLIEAHHKFALTGTPIENSLQDLFSILSIVNPGLVSESSSQKVEKDSEALKVLSKALQPFVLRRTKEQVLTDLPAKVETVLYCELSPDEKKKYDELKNFYWSQVSDKMSNKTQGAQFHILEALLRLRQAACHFGLLDKEKAVIPSAKFEMLLEQIETIRAEGKKALIFSQFTSLLKILSQFIEEKNLKYVYLDGKTKDREAVVDEFQNNPDVSLFLVSLKAGGVGLNLTAAEYVYILDPWWNPAVENQAIDRAHRIGQKNKVFAYKIIAKDTIEEKILELQKSKLDLAKNVIGTDTSLLKSLSMDDLKYLFS